MTENLPDFIKYFSCYYLRIRFRATANIKFTQPWYFEPRYTIGIAIKESGQPSLFKLLFKPESVIIDQDKSINPPSALVFRVAQHYKKSFKKNEYLDVYVSIISNKESVFNSFCKIIPGFQHFGFFKKNKLKFLSYQIFDPASSSFQKKNEKTIYQLNYDYFSKQKIEWKSILSLHFTTPTRLLVDGLFNKQISYNTIINRISRRVYELTKYHIEDSVSPYISEQNESIRLSQLNLPDQPVFKSGKKYDISGFLGWLHYQVHYSSIEDILWVIASYVHIGSFTQMGNGQVIAKRTNRSHFDEVIDLAYLSNEFQNEEQKEERIQQIKDFTYVPQTYKILKIPKSNGQYRSLNIAHPDDLLLQKFATQILYKTFGNNFLAQNFAYRKGKGAKDAILQVQEWKNKLGNTHYAIRCDINNFFDTIPINHLLSKVQHKLKDPFFMYFVNLWLKSGLIDNKNEYELNKLGIPQGSALSPILANIYLLDFDKFIAKYVTTHFVRYADDILLCIPNEKNPLSILQSISDNLKLNYKLDLNKEFFVGSLFEAFHFLGITFSGKSNKAIHVDKLNRLPKKINYALKMYFSNPTKFTETLSGLKQYYGKLLPQKELERIDEVLQVTYIKFLAHQDVKDKVLLDFLKNNGFITQKYRNEEWLEQINKVNNAKKIKLITPKTVDDKLKQQKLKHLKNFAETYELVITHPGSYIGTSKGKFVVKHKGKTIQKSHVKKLRQISIICDGVSTSSNLVKICHKNNIHIVYYDHIGNAYATTTGLENIKPELMKLQSAMPIDRQILFIHRLARNKVKNQLKSIKYYHKYYKKHDKGETLSKNIVKLNKYLETIPVIGEQDIEEYRKLIFLWEARCAGIYWKSFAILCNHHKHSFSKREYRGTQNLINQMLNYGYAILESKVLRTIHIWKLNPSISYFHTSAEGQTGLCYDLMEQYRSTIVDRSVLALIGKKEKVAQNKQGLLELETRKKIIAKINEKLFALQKHMGKEKTVYEIMQWQTKQFRSYVEQKENKPKFFKALW